MPVAERVLLDVAGVRMRALLRQVQLAIHVEVVDLLEGHASALLRFLLRWVILPTVVIFGASLAVGALLLNDKLLARVGIYLVYLRQLLLLLLLQLLRLLLLVFFQTLLTLVTGQLTVIRALRHALSLGTAGPCIAPITRALRRYRVGSTALVLGGPRCNRGWHISKVCWLDLPIDRVLVLARSVASDSNLAPIVLVMAVKLRGWCIAQHVHVRTTVRVVLLAVVGCKLVLVL